MARSTGSARSSGGGFQLPLVPLAPLAVVIIGVSVAAVTALVGVDRVRQSAEQSAIERAELLASAMAIRLGPEPVERWPALVYEMAEGAKVEAELSPPNLDPGRPLAAAQPGAVALLAEAAPRGFGGQGESRVAYASQRLEAPAGGPSALVVAVRTPASPKTARLLVNSVGELAGVLVAFAALAAYALSKATHEDVDFVRQRIARMAEGGRGWGAELVPVRSFDQVGVVTAAFNALVERFAVAERAYRRDLARAEGLDRARARFFAALSHELRTPLNAVLGFADVLLAEVEGPLTDSSREDIRVIRSSGEHLRALIDDILDLSAMETGKLRLTRSRVDVHEICGQVCREAVGLVAGRPVELRLAPGPPAHAWADPQRVRQIVSNLVQNAIKFTESGWVEVRTSFERERVVIEVEDTGPGVAEAERTSIFEEYGQAGDVRLRRHGSGLGLAIARRLTAMHEGRLVLETEVGKGSTFRLELPSDERGLP
ncbi:MAG TPA: HAMP domain-containing sensor histidine kinase [Polyangiaceae bacterium]|nr:HAMP domain-containing sensor histidine kinase [Polyangiaceae bacterium]